MVFRDRLHLVESQPVVYQLREGLEFLLQTRSYDRFIVDEIFTHQVYTSPPGFSIQDGWVIADVGGHKGIFAVFAATRAKNVKVYTFEPSPTNFPLLSRNIQRNRLSNIQAFNVAVSGQDGQAILHLHRDGGQNSLLRRSDAALRPIGDTKVESWSLQHALKVAASRINLLKMDIEGMEYDALLSCPPETLSVVERIALEYHDDLVETPGQITDLVRFLTGRGFATRLYPSRSILVAERAEGN